jgi:hypothetical protein
MEGYLILSFLLKVLHFIFLARFRVINISVGKICLFAINFPQIESFRKLELIQPPLSYCVFA